VTTVTPGMLRAESATFSSRPSVITNVLESTERPFRTLANSFVLGASNDNASNTKMFSSTTLEDSADLIAKRRTFLGSL